MTFLLECVIGLLTSYALDAYQLKRWLERNHPKCLEDYKNSVGWRVVAIDWVVGIGVMVLSASIIGRW